VTATRICANDASHRETETVATTYAVTTRNVGAGAFKGIDKKATIKCPKNMLEEYKKLLVKKGVPKTAKFKK